MIKITFDNGEVYTEEQFKKDYVRMMDSLRDDDYPKGSIDCSGVSCYKCPIKNCCDNDDYNSVFKVFKIVHDWSKAHPIVTNRDKLIKTFGNKNFNFILSSLRNDMIDEYGKWLHEEYKESDNND